MLSGDDTWLPAENDIQHIQRLDAEGLIDEEYLEKQTPEELDRIKQRLSSDRIKARIDNNTLQMDDSELDAFDEQTKADLKRFDQLIAKREDGFQEYKEWLDLAKYAARKQQIILEQGAADTTDAGLKASRVQSKKLAEARQNVSRVVSKLEMFMREKLNPTQRAAFLELRNELKERERIQAELKAIADLREIKKRTARQVFRPPDLNTVHLTQAKRIRWIQSHFYSYLEAAKWVGPGARNIREPARGAT